MLYALHGMFGLPSDWDPFLPQAICPSLFDQPPLPYAEWAKQFNQQVDPAQKNWLVGYSLGGRLGLHALIQAPHLWQGAIILSASSQNCPDKWEKDLAWSAKCATAPWETLMEEWNAQPVFAQTHTPLRKEKDFSRMHLAKAFQEWSTAKQADLQMAVEALPLPVYWVVGDKDPAAFRKLRFAHPLSKIIVCPNAGHRLQWDNPPFFKQLIQEFQDALNGPLATH